MEKHIKFKFNFEKVKNLLLILGQEVDGLDTLKIVKLLYLIDKKHLLKYGEIITGDEYYKLEYGPVPTTTYDLLRDIRDNRNMAYPELSSLLKKIFKPLTNSPVTVFCAESNPDLEVFSQNEINTIYSIIAEFGKCSGGNLIDITHKDAAWNEGIGNNPIDFRLFFSGESYSPAVLQKMEDEQENRDFLDQLK